MNTYQPTGLASYYLLFYTLFTVNALIYCQIWGGGTSRRGKFGRWLVIYFSFGPKVWPPVGLYLILLCAIYLCQQFFYPMLKLSFTTILRFLCCSKSISFAHFGQIQFKLKQKRVFATNILMHRKYLLSDHKNTVNH